MNHTVDSPPFSSIGFRLIHWWGCSSGIPSRASRIQRLHTCCSERTIGVFGVHGQGISIQHFHDVAIGDGVSGIHQAGESKAGAEKSSHTAGALQGATRVQPPHKTAHPPVRDITTGSRGLRDQVPSIIEKIARGGGIPGTCTGIPGFEPFCLSSGSWNRSRKSVFCAEELEWSSSFPWRPGGFLRPTCIANCRQQEDSRPRLRRRARLR